MTGRKRNTFLIFSILTFVVFLSAATYAYLLFSANVTNSEYTSMTACFDIDYDITNDDGSAPITGTLFQSATPKGGLSGKVAINIDSSCDAKGLAKINLNVKSGSDVLFQMVDDHCEDRSTLVTLDEYTTEEACNNQSGTIWMTEGSALKYAVYENVTNVPVSVGYITQEGQTTIHDDIKLSQTAKSIYIYVWLDGELADNSYANLSFEGYIDASAEYIKDYANKPILDDGMIPVTIANNGTVTTISSADSSWYNYDNKEWANVVLVKEEGTQKRSYYKNNSGKTVNQDDILAYYVWIPRYRYQIWTTDAKTTTSPQTINIEFESADADITTGTSVGDYMTHPAFIWDGETIAGIWVGKFETSHSSLASSTTDNNLGCTNENCANADGLIIKPNVVSLIYNSISNQFYASRSMTRSGNPFGLSASQTDSHMMKNSEWGAVAYLSHSKYGINQEIYINNSSDYYTGRSGGNVGGSVNSLATQFGSGSTTTQYNSNGYYTWTGQIINSLGTIGEYATDRTLGTNASTTGNVTGVYDMSGGRSEYVMGNYANTIGSSNFTILPDSKYYDLYNIYDVSLCTLTTCGGHALYETAGWHSDVQGFAAPGDTWFHRGGFSTNGAYAGAFYSFNDGGGGSNGFRSILINGIYNSSSSIHYSISLDNQSATNDGTTVLYGVSSDGVYLDSEYSNKMTTTSNPIMVPTKTGYTFGGYYTEINGGGTQLINASGNITSSFTNTLYNDNVTLYAKWITNTYQIKFDYENNIYNQDSSTWGFNGSSKVNNDYSYNGTTGVEVYSDAGTNKGYRIPINSDKKQNTDYELSVYAYRTQSFNGDFKVYATTLDSSGTVISYNQNIFINDNNAPLNTWTKFSAIFNSGAYASFDIILLDFTISNQGPIYISDVRLDEISTSNITYNNTYGTLPTPTRTGYTFDGWYTEPNGGGTKITSTSTMSTAENHTLYANWTQDTDGPTYTSYEFKNITSSGYDVYVYGVSDPSGVNRVQFPTWTEYNGQDELQSNWQSASSTASGTNQGNGTWYYRVNTVDHNGEAGLYNTHIYMYDNLGYRINIDTSLGSTVTVPGITITIESNNTSYGTVSASSVSVGYGAQYTTSGSIITFPGGQTISASTKNATGYTTSFTGWSSSSGTITSATTIIANFSRSANPYSVCYDANGGTGAPGCQTKTYGVDLTLSSTVPTRTGYTFLGWSTSSTATSQTWNSGGTYTSNSAATLYAVWKANETKLSDVAVSPPACAASGSTCSAGTSITINVGGSTNYEFKTLSDTGTKITLLSVSSLGTSAWNTNKSDLTTGPTTLITALDNYTSGWSNMVSQSYTIKDDANSLYTPITEARKARVVNYTEIKAAGCKDGVGYGDSCATYMGYWQQANHWSSATYVYADGTTKNPIFVNNGGYYDGSWNSTNAWGIRPVIELTK